MKKMLPCFLKGRIIIQTLVYLSISTFSFSQTARTISTSFDRYLEKSPLLFLENKGQVVDVTGNARPDVLFTGFGKGATLYLTANAIHYQFAKTDLQHVIEPVKMSNRRSITSPETFSQKSLIQIHRTTIELEGANPHPEIIKMQQGSNKTNYYNTHAPKGITGLTGYGQIVYKNVYPGIDWIIYSKNGFLEYDFMVHAGGQPNQIKMVIKDADSTSITIGGELLIKTRLGELRQHKPISYIDNKEISSSFKQNADGSIGFNVDAIAGKDLRIDPAVEWATYFGSSETDLGFSGTADKDGNVYLSGQTYSSTGIGSGGFQNIYGGALDAMLVKFSKSGNLLWATYYGGSENDVGTSASVDINGDVYLIGCTNSKSGIAFNGFQNTFSGGNWDVFIAKFDTNGKRYWASYYGGVKDDVAYTSVVDSKGFIYFAAWSGSTTGIVSPGFESSYKGGDYDAYVVKMSTNGQRVWARYFGGDAEDAIRQMAIDKNDNIMLAGLTQSKTGLATNGGYQTSFAGGNTDGFLCKMTSNGVVVWATYYGGEDDEYALDCTADVNGNIYITGVTRSLSKIAFSAYQNINKGQDDAFLVKFDPNGNRIWSTYYGDVNQDVGYACFTDKSGNIYMAGFTASTAGIASGCFQTTYEGGYGDVFLVQFDDNGRRIWGAYYGGPGADFISYATIDQQDNIYLIGYTDSETGIASNGFQNSNKGVLDAFVAKITNETARISITASTQNSCPGYPILFTASATSSAAHFQWLLNGNKMGSDASQITLSTLRNNDTVSCVLIQPANCAVKTDTSNIIVVQIEDAVDPLITITSSANNICEGTIVQFNANIINGGNNAMLQWRVNSSNAGTNSQLFASAALKNNDTISCTLVTANNCTASKTIASNNIIINVLPMVKTAVSIFASADSICKGQEVRFSSNVVNAGYHATYQWQLNGSDIGVARPDLILQQVNNGDQVRLVVHTDTVCALNEYPQSNFVSIHHRDMPPANLGPDKNICQGATAELQPGFVYDTYTWQNGSSSRKHIAFNAGVYWVKVVDGCGNISSDSIVIDFFKDTKDLLARDTAICSYESLLLKSFTQLQSYKWSNASEAPSITVNQPGLYWLIGTDLNGCTVSDTILIAAKECQKGFYVPNAFSPNQDGKNDFFRPLVFGELIKYEFKIFNRLGEMIFESRNILQGWDGKYKGIDQSANGYVWQCVFQFRSEETQYKKGAFMLLR